MIDGVFPVIFFNRVICIRGHLFIHLSMKKYTKQEQLAVCDTFFFLSHSFYNQTYIYTSTLMNYN